MVFLRPAVSSNLTAFLLIFNIRVLSRSYVSVSTVAEGVSHKQEIFHILRIVLLFPHHSDGNEISDFVIFTSRCRGRSSQVLKNISSSLYLRSEAYINIQLI